MHAHNDNDDQHDLDQRRELARRIKAAIAYGRLTRQEVADIFGMSRSEIDRFTAKNNPYAPKDRDALLGLSRRAGLPDAWWWADLGKLDVIAPAPSQRPLPEPGAAHAAPARQLRERHRQAREAKRRDTRPDQPDSQ